MITKVKKVPKRVDVLTGQKFGRLTVIEYAGRGEKYGSFWLCRCECGAMKNYDGKRLRTGKTKSCGCLRAELSSQRALARESKGRRPVGDVRLVDLAAAHPLEYITYGAMLRRCHNQKAKDYHRYGGRGRTVCDRWRFGEKGKLGFACFIEDMPPRVSRGLTIDRIDNKLGYFPGNCRWATKKEQAANK